MVLADLGNQIGGALRRLQQAPVVDEALIDECLKEISTALLQADVNIRHVADIRKKVKELVNVETSSLKNKRKGIQGAVIQELVNLLSTQKKPYKPVKNGRNVIMFVGLQGAGKTTSCTKFAHFYKKKGFKVAMICCDTFRAGAFDQLKQNAVKIRCPFYGSYEDLPAVQIAQDGIQRFTEEGYDMIIVDTSGRHMQATELFREMREISDTIEPDDHIFVVDSHIGQACKEQASAFADAVSIGSIIVTKLDGHAKGGGALSAVAACNAPIAFIGLGENFDELESFEAESFIKRILGFGDLKGLFNSLQSIIDPEKQPDMMKRLEKGKFSFRDLYDQFKSLQQMGSTSQLMSMIPGMSKMMENGNPEETTKKIKCFMVMMDSFTPGELDCKDALTASRMKRIANGSGTSVKLVGLLQDEFKRMSKTVEKMSKSGLLKNNKANDMSNFSRNPKMLMQKMRGVLDPQMIASMGGEEGMYEMMKQFGSMDQSQLMSQMGMGGKPKGKRR